MKLPFDRWPAEAKRRSYILAVAHVSGSMRDSNVQEILAKWVARGELSEEEREVMRQLAAFAVHRDPAPHDAQTPPDASDGVWMRLRKHIGLRSSGDDRSTEDRPAQPAVDLSSIPSASPQLSFGPQSSRLDNQSSHSVEYQDSAPGYARMSHARPRGRLRY